MPTSAMTSKEARNPPTFTTPFARPVASTGVNVRARSKPTIEAGPPVAMAQTRSTSNHSGDGSGRARTAPQTSAITATTASTIRER